MKRTQILTILTMSVQNPHFPGYFFNGNSSNLFCLEGAAAWLYNCPHFLSPLYEVGEFFDCIPTYSQDTVMYNGLSRERTLNFATLISRDNNPQNVIDLDPDKH